MPGLYLNFAPGNDSRTLLNVLIQKRDLFKLLKRNGKSWIGLFVKDGLIFVINKNIASGNLVFRELPSSSIRAIQARFIYTIESLL
jgi:hypothetical protein